MEQKFGHVVGYRSWELLYPDYLSNVNKHTVWEAGKKLEAVCTSGVYYQVRDHGSPDKSCTCGVYAYRDQDLSVEGLKSSTSQIYGQVALWGKVLRFSKGYRAQFAYPLEFYFNKLTTSHMLSLFTKVAEKYQVPLINITSLVVRHEAEKRIKEEIEADRQQQALTRSKEEYHREQLDRGRRDRKEFAEWRNAQAQRCNLCGEMWIYHRTAEITQETVCPKT